MHLVVWIKFDLEVDPSADELAPAVRKEIDGYVDRTFRARASNDSVIITPLLFPSCLAILLALFYSTTH